MTVEIIRRPHLSQPIIRLKAPGVIRFRFLPCPEERPCEAIENTFVMPIGETRRFKRFLFRIVTARREVGWLTCSPFVCDKLIDGIFKGQSQKGNPFFDLGCRGRDMHIRRTGSGHATRFEVEPGEKRYAAHNAVQRRAIEQAAFDLSGTAIQTEQNWSIGPGNYGQCQVVA